MSNALGEIIDTAGIGGDGPVIANSLMTGLAVVVVVGAKTAKYGNCVVLLKRGVVDASEDSGSLTDSKFEVAGETGDEAGTIPVPVCIPYLVTCPAGLTCVVSGTLRAPNTSGLPINLVNLVYAVTGRVNCKSSLTTVVAHVSCG